MTESFRTILQKAWFVVAEQVANFLPKLLAGVIVLLIGFVIARLVRGLTARFFVAVRLDRISDRLGISAFLARGDVRYTVAEILATVIYWLVLLLSFQLLGLVLGLEGLAHFFGQILGYLPRLVVALVIILAGILIGSFFGGAVQVAASNAGFPAAKPLGQTVKYLISFFALVMALEELRIATQLLVATLQIVIAAVALALALAFGLGCKDLAGEAVRRWVSRTSNPSGGETPSSDEGHPNAETTTRSSTRT
jgi:fumarate reductase subunit C